MFAQARELLVRPLREPAGVVLASAIVLIVAWGHHGDLHQPWDGWRPFEEPAGRDELIPGIPWDQEWISFAAGLVLLVLVPCLIARRVGLSLRDLGLGLPERNVPLAIGAFVALIAVSIVPFAFSTGDEGMQATYPLYRGELEGADFWIYELGYLAFFVVIEFVFRGYLLLGLYERFGSYAIYISMLSYTAWHIDKPTPELVGTLFWGPVAGVVVILTRSIWPVVLAHWLLNVALDLWLR
jgi:membrane protease YdiL (CAAX protease family)